MGAGWLGSEDGGGGDFGLGVGAAGLGAAGGLLVILIEPADSLNGLEVLGGEDEQRLKERDEGGIFGEKKV